MAEKEWFLARLHNQVHGTDISWIERPAPAGTGAGDARRARYAFGSSEVNIRFNKIQQALFWNGYAKTETELIRARNGGRCCTRRLRGPGPGRVG